MFQKLFIALACAASITHSSVLSAEPLVASGTSAAPAPIAPKKFKVFLLTQSMGFKHAVVSRPAGVSGGLSLVEKTWTEIADRTGVFSIECSQDATQLTAAKLKDIDALVFFTSGKLEIKPPDFSELQNWLRGGKAIVGIHSATDTFREYKPFYEMMGGVFLRHPWDCGGIIENLEPAHSAVNMFPPEFVWRDELCEHQFFDARKARVLLALNIEKSSPKRAHCVPICWVREYGKGRVFYTNFGNSEAVWGEELFRRHLLGGLKWALKLEPGDGCSNQNVQEALDTRARLASLEIHKSWLVKAARSVRFEPNVALAAAEKLAQEDETQFLKAHELINSVRAEEKLKESFLGKSRRPSEKDLNHILSRRTEVMKSLIPPKD